MDGKMEKADNYTIRTDRTEVSINLEPQESVFVVFRNKASVNQKNTVKTVNLVSSDNLSNDWTVKFMPEYGYDAEIKLPELIDWSKSGNDEIKYYSGSALYTKVFNIDADKLQDGLSSIQKAVDLFGGLLVKDKGTSTKSDYLPRPVYKRFDD
jgi:hypothetical protein